MRELRVRDIRWEAQDVVSLGLTDPDGGELPAWEPGAHLDLELRTGLQRQYSLCGDPDDRRLWRVAVLREPESRGGSAFVHEQLRPGQRVSSREPANHFAFEPADAYEFIAGGIGITPILPMLAAAQAAGVPWRLLYGGRRRASMAFLEELAAYGDKVTVAPQEESGLLDIAGRLAGWREGVAVYCCGPEALLSAVEAHCAAAAMPAGALRVERFTPLISLEEARQGDAFDVHLERSGLTVRVEEGQTILEAVEAAGIMVECSCLEGVCGTCETAVLEGEPDHRDSLLTETERAANDTMMICVSRSRSASLRLDL